MTINNIKLIFSLILFYPIYLETYLYIHSKMINEKYNDEEVDVVEKVDDSDNDSDVASNASESDYDDDENKLFNHSAGADTVEKVAYNTDDDDDEDDEDDEDENYLQKFDESLRSNIISDHHPELHQHNYEEIDALTNIAKNEFGIVIDPLHKTLPFLTKYERARVLGERAKQINSGSKPFVKIEPSMIDGYLIALKELDEKMIPFIVKRPLPHGGCEYWKLKDLELL